MNNCETCVAKGIGCAKYKNASCKAIKDIVIKANNRAVDDFSNKLKNWKPKDEEYRDFQSVVDEIHNELTIK